MNRLLDVLQTGWVLLWLSGTCVAVPAAMLGPETLRHGRAQLGPAFVWTSLTLGAGVPLLATLHGFNWATALLLTAILPASIWWLRHGRRAGAHLMDVGRVAVVWAVAPDRSGGGLSMRGEIAVALAALPLLALGIFAAPFDVRLPAPADFDTLWRTHALLTGMAACDPLASIAAVLTRLSTGDTLHVIRALRLALAAGTAAAAADLVAATTGRAGAGVAVALGVVLLAPEAPAASWGIALACTIGCHSFLTWVRTRSDRDGWHTAAALLLAAALLVPFSGRPGVLLAVSASPQFLEPRAAPAQVLALRRSQPDSSWMLVAMPEQQLELGPAGRPYDLARFVSRFESRSADPSFRFDLPVHRVFVFVDKRPPAVATPPASLEFFARQPAVYRVPAERRRLQEAARKLCDDYRRTHAGATIAYDDAVLRVYRFEV